MVEKQPALMKHLHWIGHDTFRLDSPLVVYIDPWQLPESSPPADLILVSHEHHDHCSSESVAQIRKAGTVILASAGAVQSLGSGAELMRPGEKRTVGPVTVETVPAYNLDKPFHPKEANHLGFILQIGEERLYFAGDTDVIPEMKSIRCDVALLPVSGKYVMTADEAVEAVEILRPEVAVPMHYGAGVAGTAADADKFSELSPVPVVVLEAEGSS